MDTRLQRPVPRAIAPSNCTTRSEVTLLSTRGKAPKHVTWVICLILFLLAVLNHFGMIHLPNGLGDWSWIVGYALLLIAVQVRDL
jgi:hypothetical protein